MNEFIDKRDGNSYRIIKINNLYWFAENLKYQGVPHHFPNRDSDNIHKYGLLYTWENAIKACPEGWRLPTKNEFEQLIELTGADDDDDDDSSSLRDKSWKKGRNSSKFSALPAGYRLPNGSPSSFGSDTRFWSITAYYGSNGAYYLLMYSGNTYMSSGRVDYAVSVRCVKEVQDEYY